MDAAPPGERSERVREVRTELGLAGLRRPAAPPRRRPRTPTERSGIGSTTHDMTILAPILKHRLGSSRVRSLREPHARLHFIDAT